MAPELCSPVFCNAGSLANATLPAFAKLRLMSDPPVLQEKVVRLRGDGMVPQQSAQVLPGVASLSSACRVQAVFPFKSTA